MLNFAPLFSTRLVGGWVGHAPMHRQLVRRAAATMTMQRTNCLITWDIDGTLMGGPGKKKDNSAHKAAIERAMHVVWGIDGKVGIVAIIVQRQ
jgi:hypothetical protein